VTGKLPAGSGNTRQVPGIAAEGVRGPPLWAKDQQQQKDQEQQNKKKEQSGQNNEKKESGADREQPEQEMQSAGKEDESSEQMSPEEARMLLEAYGQDEARDEVKQKMKGRYGEVLRDW